MTEEKTTAEGAETASVVAEETKEETVSTAEKTTEEVKTDDSNQVKEVPEKFKKLVEEIDKMSVLDLSEFVKVLEDHYGVSAAAPVAMVAGGAPVSGGEEAQEEKTAFDVILANAGTQKIAVIKAVREIKPDLGLKEAKDLVDGAPKELLKGAKKEDADAAKTKLEAAGATVELK